MLPKINNDKKIIIIIIIISLDAPPPPSKGGARVNELVAVMSGIQSDLVQLEDFVQGEEEEPSNSEKESAGPGVSSKRPLTPRSRAYKNVLGAGVSAMLSFGVLVALDNLQSSFNEAEGLGYTNLAIGSATFLIFGFFGSSLIKLLGTNYKVFIDSVILLCTGICRGQLLSSVV